ncbi:hypothetical protein DASC09_009670 [Saccharomycopsis crataegensis]|uniref:Uncharacterized protein n=1 Tax=Saccharomycopsis crataegensis TaxID=43959 RepID=A0AAV5QFW8_9ASCO|nr:hypothetical protein DASC09_009670 [Saccharomycopsis crataegensis]
MNSAALDDVNKRMCALVSFCSDIDKKLEAQNKDVNDQIASLKTHINNQIASLKTDAIDYLDSAQQKNDNNFQKILQLLQNNGNNSESA